MFSMLFVHIFIMFQLSTQFNSSSYGLKFQNWVIAIRVWGLVRELTNAQMNYQPSRTVET